MCVVTVMVIIETGHLNRPLTRIFMTLSAPLPFLQPLSPGLLPPVIPQPWPLVTLRSARVNHMDCFSVQGDIQDLREWENFLEYLVLGLWWS